MNNYDFDSSATYGPSFDTGFTQEQVKNEVMFFNSDLHYAHDKGGPITKAFINAFVDEWYVKYGKYIGCSDYDFDDFVFDSRVHMLMPGWFPCIPGFHHDDVPRKSFADDPLGQPDYSQNRLYHSRHCMGMVNGDICPTQFALGRASLPIPEHDIIYKHWHPMVEQLVADERLRLCDATSGRLLYFDCDTLHQGQAARANGWRWFGRISWNTERTKHITNEERRQVQVYLEYPMEGW